MNKRTLIATAVTVFAATSFASTSFAAGVKCGASNACKGQSACKTAHNACSGQNSCRGKGYLMLTAEACTAAKAAMQEK